MDRYYWSIEYDKYPYTCIIRRLPNLWELVAGSINANINSRQISELNYVAYDVYNVTQPQNRYRPLLKTMNWLDCELTRLINYEQSKLILLLLVKKNPVVLVLKSHLIFGIRRGGYS